MLDRVIAVESPGVGKSNMKIERANSRGRSGGVFVGPDDTLTLSNSLVTENEAPSGGGIAVGEAPKR